MKKTQLLIFISLSAASAAFVSCSESDNDNGLQEAAGSEIRFAAGTERTRSGDITTNTLTTFNVYAYTGTSESPKLFMDNVTVNKTGTNTWTYSPVKYWPAGETVDFYAFSPAGWVGDDGPLSPVKYTVTGSGEDLVYAVNPDLSGVAGQANAQVILNFRHAMSKVTVKMRSSNSTLTVRVTNVALVNIKTKGTFTFPRESTSKPLSAETVGTWTDQNTPLLHILHMSQTPSEVITLTETPTEITSSTGLGEQLYVIPQQLVWNENGRGDDTYITVMGSIYDTATGSKLWPNANTPAENIVTGSTFGDGLLKFPLSTSAFTEWQPGYHYVYNLVINSNEDMGTIEFGNPTVDTYVDVEAVYD